LPQKWRKPSVINDIFMHADHKFIEAFRQNNSLVTREIYEKHAKQAQQWICNNNGTIADARDMFQEAILVVYEKSLDPNFVLTCPLSALLHVIYSRKWYDRLRKENRSQKVINSADLRSTFEQSETDAGSLADEASELEERQKKIANAFQQLSDLCQQLLRLLGEGKAPKEVVALLNMNSVETLYRRKNACASRWRELLTA
jgi:RNA polymerase sigma factor (sigma-70 family)